MVVVIQALVILFTGAMEGLFRPGLQRIFTTLAPAQKAEAIERNIVKSES
jgi:simple sugar transport system permease protein